MTGGDGNDVFVYSAVNQSIRSTPDVITDFATGMDKISITAATTGTVINLGRFSSVANDGEGLNSLDGIAGGLDRFDAYYAASGTLNVDVDGDGNIADGTDYSIVSSKAISAADINYTISASTADTIFRLGQGVDTLSTTAAEARFVIVGSISQAEVAIYDAATVAVVSSGDATATGVGNNTLASSVVNYNDLLSVRTVSEATSGDSIAATAAAGDVLELFGTVNLSGITISGIDTLIVHSNVTMTDAQLANIGAITFAGNTPHTLTVTSGGVALSASATAAAFTGKTVTVTGNGDATTVQLGAGTAQTVTAFATTVSASAGVTIAVAAPTLTKDTSVAKMGDAYALATAGSAASHVIVDALGMSSAQVDKALESGSLSKTASISNLTLSFSQYNALITNGLDDDLYAEVGTGRITVEGTSGNDTLNYSGDYDNNGASATPHSIVGGGGDDTIYASDGVDVIVLGSGNSTVIMKDGTSGELSIVGGTVVSTLGLDKILGFNAGDKIELFDYSGAGKSVIYPSAANLANTAALQTAMNSTASGFDKYAYIKGTYVAAANTFTFNAAGSDVLFAYNEDGDAAVEAVVLVGVSATTTGTTGTSGITGG